MTKPTQDKETLREAVAMTVGKHIYGETRGRTYLHVTRPCADEILATMFERLRTPSEGMIGAGCEQIILSLEVSPCHIWQAMLDAFQQENSDA